MLSRCSLNLGVKGFSRVGLLGALSWGVANDQCAVKMAMAIGNQANIPSFVPLHISEHMDRNEIRTVPNVPTS